MVASAGGMMGASIASTALGIADTGRGIRQRKQAERAKRNALTAQLQEQLDIAQHQNTELSMKTAQAVSLQMAQLYGVGVFSGSTADMMRTSMDIHEAFKTAQNARNTQAAMDTIVTGIEQSIIAEREAKISAGFSLAETLLVGGQKIGQHGTAISQGLEFDVKMMGPYKDVPTGKDV
jgi:hypothetical protein